MVLPAKDVFAEVVPATMVNWDALIDRVRNAQATVGVVGLGYVGLPLATTFARRGFRVIGLEASVEKVTALADGRSYILDVPSETIGELVTAERFVATGDIATLATADAIIICVPTPCRGGRAPDLGYVERAARAVAGILRPGQLVVLESTTYPGTTEEVLVPLLEESGLRCGQDVQVAFSPERIDPGNRQYHVENTPKVVGGLGAVAGDLACALYGTIIGQIVRVDSPREAEMEKLIENTFRHINIALANELAVIARKLRVNIWQALEAAATKPYGFMPFYPGPGVGGHCIPIDPHYLSWKAKEMGAETSFIELAERINSGMPEYVARLVIDAVNAAGKSIRGARVLVIGLAYKRDIDDLRESPALVICDLLHRHGAVISYHDPYIATCQLAGQALRSTPLTARTLSDSDCALIVTDHSSVDRQLLLEHAPLIVDTRNMLGAYRSPKVVGL